jgi:hypothetical protein
VRSEGATITGEVMLPGEAPAIDTVLRRELACAIVDNRPVGNCRNVEDRLHRLVRPVR